MSSRPRQLEPQVMEGADEAQQYDEMDHTNANGAFVEDLLAATGWGPGDEGWFRSVMVLDAGTGTARIPVLLAEHLPNAKIHAADASMAMLDLAEEHLEAADLTDRVLLHLADCTALPYPDDHFDFVISNSLVHHLPEPAAGFAEFLRVLAPGGLLFVRDLFRPESDEQVEALVAKYAGGENAEQQQLLRQSLQAALTVEEVEQLLASFALPTSAVRMTSDRHWTIQVRLPE